MGLGVRRDPENSDGVTIIGYADDTLVLGFGRTRTDAKRCAELVAAQAVRVLRKIGLSINEEKTEVIWIGLRRTDRLRRKDREARIDGCHVGVGSHLRYLGVELDSRWGTRYHFRLLYPRLRNAAAALGGLLPNLRGPSNRPWRLYAGIVASMAMYGAPVWAEALSSDWVSQSLLNSAQRMINLRSMRAYRTVSTAAAGVLAGAPPLDLHTTELRKINEARCGLRYRSGGTPASEDEEETKRRVRRKTMEAWKRRLEEDERARRNRTMEAILV